MNLPDAWRFILIDNNLVKLFRSYDGAWAIAEEWNLNSGTTKIVLREDELYDVYGFSGSIYAIRKEQGNLNSYTSGVYRSIIKKLKDADVPVRELSLEEAIEYSEEMKLYGYCEYGYRLFITECGKVYRLPLPLSEIY